VTTATSTVLLLFLISASDIESEIYVFRCQQVFSTTDFTVGSSTLSESAQNIVASFPGFCVHESF